MTIRINAKYHLWLLRQIKGNPFSWGVSFFERFIKSKRMSGDALQSSSVISRQHFLILLCLSGMLTMAFGTNARAERIAFLAFAQDYWQVWVMPMLGGEPSQLTDTPYDKNRLSCYSDGQHLFVTGVQGQVTKLNVTSAQSTRIDLPLGDSIDAVISPNDKYIAFSKPGKMPSDRGDLWLLTLASGDARPLVKDLRVQHQPVWSHDSSTLYFLSARGNARNDIWSLELATGTRQKINLGGNGHFDTAVNQNGGLLWSANPSGNYEIWLQQSGKSPIQLTEHPALDASPAWSPDASAIVFESSRRGASNLWLLKLSDKKLTQLTDFARGARRPVWCLK